MNAVLSSCGRYRYALWRTIQAPLGTSDETCLFVMLNPSTADASRDDPTIRRCLGFARDWGFGRLAVANLFALRATDPEELRRHGFETAVGPENDGWIETLAAEAALAVVAWGSHRIAEQRAREVMNLLDARFPDGVGCLGTTKDGAPRHPLFVARTTPRQPFEPIEAAV